MPKTDLVLRYLKNCKDFNGIFKNKIKILSAGDGNCVASFLVKPEDSNPLGSIHGGLSATLIDFISSFALLTHKNGYCRSASLNINTSYLKGAMVGEEIIVNAKTIKAGKSVAFLAVEITNKTTGEILVTGEHTKLMMPGTTIPF